MPPSGRPASNHLLHLQLNLSGHLCEVEVKNWNWECRRRELLTVKQVGLPVLGTLEIISNCLQHQIKNALHGIVPIQTSKQHVHRHKPDRTVCKTDFMRHKYDTGC